MRAMIIIMSMLGFLFVSPQVLADAKTSGLSNASTTQIETTVHNYLIKKPEVVVEAMQAYQQKQQESMQQMFKETQKNSPKFADALFHDSKDPVEGNQKGKVSMVEFSDYQCSHCIEGSVQVQEMIKTYPDLRVVVKEFPIRGPISDLAARAALAANKQGKYPEFREALFRAGFALTEEKIYEIAKTLSLDVDKLKLEMNSDAIRDQITQNRQLAGNLKLMGTPAFFIAQSDVKPTTSSDKISYIPGVISKEQLKPIMDKLK